MDFSIAAPSQCKSGPGEILLQKLERKISNIRAQGGKYQKLRERKYSLAYLQKHANFSNISELKEISLSLSSTFYEFSWVCFDQTTTEAVQWENNIDVSFCLFFNVIIIAIVCMSYWYQRLLHNQHSHSGTKPPVSSSSWHKRHNQLWPILLSLSSSSLWTNS